VVELVLVVGVLGCVMGATALVALAPWHWLFGGGLVLTGVLLAEWS